MSVPSGARAEPKDPMASTTTTLTQPQPVEQENGPPIQTKAAPDSNPYTEPQPSTEKEDLEDEEWRESPAHPWNWPRRKKSVDMAIVSFYTFLPPFTSSVIAPGLPQIAEHFHETNATIIGMSLSIILLAWTFAPLIIAPLSEMYGRRWFYHISNILTLVFSLGCAFAPTMGSFIGLRFLCGIFGATPLAIGAGSVADLYAPDDRAVAMALFTLGPLLGPIIGPVVGGFVIQNIGYKYVFIIIAAFSGLLAILSIPFMHETYAPVIRMRRDLASGEPSKIRNARRHLGSNAQLGRWKCLWINLSRPVILLTRSFICFILSLYMALVYGIYYLMFATFSDIFTNIYGFGVEASGLAYLGLGVGFILASIFSGYFSGWVYDYCRKKNNGVGKPEMRIPTLLVGSVCTPIGLLVFGWTAKKSVHWIVPIVGTGIFGFGLMISFLPVLLYLVDAFTYAASASSASTVFRNLLGFIFPLFGAQMYAALGIGWGNTLLAILAIVIGIPFPIWIWYMGEEMRSRNPLNR